MVPAGELAVRRGQHVHAADGTIGQVKGLVIDPASRHVTHVLLQEGHPLGRKEVAGDGVQLNISKQQVQDLPPVDTAHPAGKTRLIPGIRTGAVCNLLDHPRLSRG